MRCAQCGLENPSQLRRCLRCRVQLRPFTGTVELPAFLAQSEPVAASVPPVTLEPPEPAYDTRWHPESPAGFALRLGAATTDLLVLGAPLAAWMAIGPMLPDRGESIAASVVLLALAYLAIGEYFARMESSPWMGTIGQRAVGIMVTDLNGERLSYAHARVRQRAKIWSTLTLGVGYVMILFSPNGQALHDQVAGTLVLRRHAPNLPFAQPPDLPEPLSGNGYPAPDGGHA